MNWDVFKKPGVESKAEPKPVAPKPTKQPVSNTRPASADKKQEPDLGQNIDPQGMSDEDKQCWAFAVQNYTGQQDPQQWAAYYSQKEGYNFDCLLQAANIIHNTVMYYNAPVMEYVPEQEKRKFPWWSAFRDFNVETNPVFNKGTWSPSKSILGATMGNKFMG